MLVVHASAGRVAQPSDGKPPSGCPILRGFLRRVGATNLDEMCLLGPQMCGSKAVVSHPSQEREGWGTRSFAAEPNLSALASAGVELVAGLSVDPSGKQRML